jgi:hypothetical protein
MHIFLASTIDELNAVMDEKSPASCSIWKIKRLP